MQKNGLIFFLMLCCSQLWAQNYKMPLSLISSSGGMGQTSINGGTANVEWTLGETFIYGGNVGATVISNGEQQNDVGFGVGINEIFFSALNIYPNPTKSYLQIEQLPKGENTISIVSLTGKVLQTLVTKEQNIQLLLQNYAAGMYSLNIVNGTNSISKSIIINP